MGKTTKTIDAARNPVSIVKKSALVTIYNQRYLFMLLLPSAVFVILFQYVPIYGISIAFKQFHPLLGIGGSPWVGLKHFIDLFNSLSFTRVLSNTLIINIYHIVFGFPAPIILALLLNELRHLKFKRSVQTITYLPHFLSWVIVGTFVVRVLSPTGGLVNEAIRAFGGRPVLFLLEPRYFRGILVSSAIWKSVGWGSILYLAALATIDPNLYEAAVIDGAGRWRQTFSITIPGIKSTITILLVLRFASMLESNFEQIFVLYNPSVYRVGDVISTYIYRIGLGQAKYSETAALGVFNSLIGLTLILSGNKIIKKYNDVAMW
jgi:putative aldouronate transport system permease protein